MSEPSAQDQVFVTGLALHAYHGVMQHEAKVGQTFKLDLMLDLDLAEASRTDKLVDEYSKDGRQARFQEQVGLPLATYPSGPKVRWILDNVDGAADKADSGDLLFGNMDTWVVWNLTGGTDGGIHITDVTNASRTMLMDLKTLDWDEGIMDVMGIPRAMLPEIKASSEVYGEVSSGGALNGIT